MRIVAGSLGGRVFDSPRSWRTHPMSDRIRGALFNTLGDISGLTVLDVFAGSGALSFEAISRGAKQATAVDIDKTAISTVVNSANALGLSRQVKAIHAGVSSWLETSPSDQMFDIILADPPYDDLQLAVVEKLLLRLKPAGIFVLSWPCKAKAPDFKGLGLVQQNNYGDSQLVFYKVTV
jgi:16S rRNA (guanine966-N2)-methyltransferase